MRDNLDLKERRLDLGESYQDLSSPGTPPVQRRQIEDCSNQTKMNIKSAPYIHQKSFAKKSAYWALNMVLFLILWC